MPDIIHLLTIDAPPATIYKAITEQAGIQGWWTVQTKIEPVIGSTAVFDFGNRYHNEMQILNLLPLERVEWECRVGDPEWVGTRIIFELIAGDNGSTDLRFMHAGWKEGTDFFGICNHTWGHYLTSLKSLCESGDGSPFTP